jgi:hypothetical protein
LYTWDDYGFISAISNSKYRSILCRLSLKGRGFRAEPQNSIPWKLLSEMSLAVGNVAFFSGQKQVAEKAGWSTSSPTDSQAVPAAVSAEGAPRPDRLGI